MNSEHKIKLLGLFKAARRVRDAEVVSDVVYGGDELMDAVDALTTLVNELEGMLDDETTTKD